MARPAQFDRGKTVEAAMKLFWRRGYNATSLPDLLKTMSIARSSFYASFGTKRDLFVECLELFAERTLAMLEEAAGQLPATALPRAFFESTLLAVSLHRQRLGCMMVNTVLELADVDTELSQLAAQELNVIEARFAAAFQLAQQRGELEYTHAPAQLARQVMTINLGLRVESRRQLSRNELKSTIDSSLSMLGLAA